MKRMYKSEKGQALVEMAIILPILLLLLFSIIEFGWVFGAQLLVTHASREGARYGAVHSSDATVLTDITSRSQAVASVLTGLGVSPTYTNSGNRRQGDIIVTITYPVNIITPVVRAIIGSSVVTVQSSCQMKVE